jgi:hypothetical protein
MTATLYPTPAPCSPKSPQIPDYEVSTGFLVVNEYGEVDAGSDSCVDGPDGTAWVREAVCDPVSQTLGFIDFDCSEIALGLTCVAGACQ